MKENFIFLTVDRNVQNLLDYAKVADVIVPVLSCREVDQEAMTLNPHEAAKAFDELAYEQMSSLRHQGLPNTVCVLQHLNEIGQKQDRVLKLFQRFFQSEFESGDKTIVASSDEDIFTLLRRLQSTPETKMPWRDMRGYMLVEKVSH